MSRLWVFFLSTSNILPLAFPFFFFPLPCCILAFTTSIHFPLLPSTPYFPLPFYLPSASFCPLCFLAGYYFFFNWRIIALQCCVSFWCTRKSAIYTYIHHLPLSPPLTHPHPTPLGCHRVPSWGPCAYISFPLAICSTYGNVYMSVSSRVLDQSLRQRDKVSELPWAGETFHPAEVNVTKGISHYLGTHSPLAQCREGGPEFFPHRNSHYQNSHFL